MNDTNFRIVLRNFKKHKVLTTINIAGLTIGMLSALFIFEYVFFEKSFDGYHKNADQVYRIVYNRYQDGKLQWETANSYFPTGKWLKDNYSEVVDWAVITCIGNGCAAFVLRLSALVSQCIYLPDKYEWLVFHSSNTPDVLGCFSCNSRAFELCIQNGDCRNFKE